MIQYAIDKNLYKLQVIKYKQPKNWGKKELLNTIDKIISEGGVQRIELDISDLIGIKYYQALKLKDLPTKKQLVKFLKGVTK